MTFKTVTVPGGITAGLAGTDPFPSKEQAEVDAKVRNERAEKLGIKTRYEVAEAS